MPYREISHRSLADGTESITNHTPFYISNRDVADKMARSGIANLIVGIGFILLSLLDLSSSYGIGVYYGMPVLMPAIAFLITIYVFSVDRQDKMEFIENIRKFSAVFQASKQRTRETHMNDQDIEAYFESLEAPKSYAKDYAYSYVFWRIGKQLSPISIAGFASCYMMGYFNVVWQLYCVIALIVANGLFLFTEVKIMKSRSGSYAILAPLGEIVQESSGALKWMKRQQRQRERELLQGIAYQTEGSLSLH